jgi:hypothetical protein
MHAPIDIDTRPIDSFAEEKAEDGFSDRGLAAEGGSMDPPRRSD